MKEKLKVIVILGPTSSGKTELSLKLAKKFNGVIISADSRQIYKDMDIATAKIKKENQQNIPHYMIDIVNPDENFTVSLYQKTVYNLLDSIAKNNLKKAKKIIPFIVGGTGLYIKSVVDGYKIPHVPPNQQLREKLEKLSSDKLVAKLIKLDPNTLVDTSNKRRIIRTIEIINAIGKTTPKFQAPNYNFLQIGIDLSKNKLNKKIEDKVDKMYQAGLIKETKKLIDKDYNMNSPAFSALGYKYIHAYLKKRITLKQALELMKRDTKRFAKRQLTWFKKDKRIHWIKNYPETEKLIQNFLR